VRETKQRNLYRIIIGVLMVVSGLVSIVLASGEAVIGSILLVAGLVFLITGITRHLRNGESPESDERSKKIGAYGISYA
jgi:heme A synthase